MFQGICSACFFKFNPHSYIVAECFCFNSIWSYKQPFILANFNGTLGDIDVITHEFGHALAAKYSYDQGDYELSVGSMETAECHSMSMEFFCEKASYCSHVQPWACSR